MPADLKAKMSQFPEINWSEVARQAIIQKTRQLEQLNQMLSKSTLTEQDTVQIGREIKRRVWTRHRRR
ncbi:MAG: hypothetical protein HYZ94_00470 [Candidatus Omnitrophica bacterium]|nr:hypothetical protein [Candidatus Omnitrophota bacterium]